MIRVTMNPKATVERFLVFFDLQAHPIRGLGLQPVRCPLPPPHQKSSLSIIHRLVDAATWPTELSAATVAGCIPFPGDRTGVSVSTRPGLSPLPLMLSPPAVTHRAFHHDGPFGDHCSRRPHTRSTNKYTGKPRPV